jgi:DnaJ-class molecular chaperone
MNELKEVCPICGGAGQIITGENLVTMDMAIDAGDRSMEGMHHSYNYEPCENCEGSGQVEKCDIGTTKKRGAE